MARGPVGIVGLGLLGSALAERLLAQGHAVVGHDLDPIRREALVALGGTAVDAAASVAQRCRRILLSLPTSDVSTKVVSILLPWLQPGDLILDTTTGEPAAMIALGQRLAGHGVAYLDATVVGSSADARAGRCVLLVGGERSAFDACADLYPALAERVFPLGPSGNGAKMKLVVNLVLGLHRAVLAEGLALAERLDLDPTTTLEVLRSGAAASRVMDAKGEKMLRRDFTPQARLSQHLKDVQLILAAGDRVAARLPLSEVHERLLTALEQAGLGSLDNSAIRQAFD